MSRHTPGPWVVRHDDMVCSKEGRIIADCESTSYNMRPAPPIAEDKANARLIAAAPELLEGLKQLLAMQIDCDGVTVKIADYHCHQTRQAQAAINKAEGREG